MTENEIATNIWEAALNVHRNLDPGLLENSYQECLCYEIRKRDVKVVKEMPLPLIYEEVKLEVGYRVDLMVENKVIIEVKAVEALNDVHLAQVLTYLKLSNSKLGLLINFNVALLKNGFRRVINGKLD